MLKHLLFCSGWSKRIAAAATAKHYVLHTLCVQLNFFSLCCFERGNYAVHTHAHARCRQRTNVPMQASYFMIEMWQQAKGPREETETVLAARIQNWNGNYCQGHLKATAFGHSTCCNLVISFDLRPRSLQLILQIEKPIRIFPASKETNSGAASCMYDNNLSPNSFS